MPFSLDRIWQRGRIICIIRPIRSKSKIFMPIKKYPIILNKNEVKKLLEAPSKTSLTGLRAKAILKITLNCGLRISEVVNLLMIDINLEFKELKIVDGKGGRDRILTIPESTAEILREWRRKKPESDWFFSTLKGKKLGARYLQKMVKRMVKKAGVDKRIHFHSLRHFFATEFYKQTKDIYLLSLILGHASIGTTTIYISLSGLEIKKGMAGFEEF